MENNVLSVYDVVIDRYNKKHKVFSVRFKDLQTVTSFTEKYNPECFGQYLLAPVFDDGEIQKTADGNIDYNNGFYDDLVEVIELALDNRETRDEIDQWLDMELAKEIILKFLGLSTMKKKTDVKQKTEWRNLFASIVANTSMTMNDIANLRVNEFEELLEGMNENADEQKRLLDGGHETLEGDDAIAALMG